ncbi:G-protein coupled receptor Mth2 [Frankliniella fusca]|uniref:G-protein coupled receptor Mth2 n=1 Tax=Frankliniella fusca TaxID=407009 RepID=A0AAE1HEE2_9NEOP|nr:G-protein coupled receptor Mth2 [Frankliniella fusca]
MAAAAMALAVVLSSVLAVVAAGPGPGPARPGPGPGGTFRKCCPSGQQLSIDLRTCTPLRPRPRTADTVYTTDDAAAAAAGAAGQDAAKDRTRRGVEDWGWLPEDTVILDSASLEVVTVDDLRRAVRDAPSRPQRAPRVDMAAPPPCAPHDTELLFWDDVQLFSNGSLLVNQFRPDLFRPPQLDGPGDEGERSILFAPGSFCMDRLTFAPVVPLEDEPQDRDVQDVEAGVEDAVEDERAEQRGASNATALGDDGQDEDDDDTYHVILLCPCGAGGAGCVRKCCHPRSVLVVDAKGDTGCRTDPLAISFLEEHKSLFDVDRQRLRLRHQDAAADVASATLYNMGRAMEARREWGPSKHRRPDQHDDPDVFLLHGLPHCSNPLERRFLLNSAALFNTSQAAQFWILADGSAVVDGFGADNTLPAGSFCGEVALDEQTGLRAANLLVCADPDVLSTPFWQRMLYGVLAATGAVFLAATLVVHACLPELRRSLHSSNLMAHTGSLLVAYLALSVNALASPAPSQASCLILAFVLQFSFLAAFFWLNVMCIDISWAFSGLRLPQGSAAERDRKKFLWYSLYAWGCTAAITLTTVALNFMPTSLALHPQVGVVNCWFKETTAVLLYFYGPMAFLLLTNLVLFVYTAARILAVRKDTAILHKSDNSQRHTGAETQRLVLYLKLFCLMGLTWVTEIISWAAGGRDYYWYATDVINLLRAVFIFIIFCCKRKVLRLVLDRLTGDGGDPGGSRGGRSGVGPRGRGRGAGTITSSLTLHQDARRLQHTSSQDSNVTTLTSPSATPEALVLTVR